MYVRTVVQKGSVCSSERRADVTAAIWKVQRQSMGIYVKNNPAKSHFDPIRNDGTLWLLLA